MLLRRFSSYYPNYIVHSKQYKMPPLPKKKMKWTGTTGGDYVKKAPHEVAEIEEIDSYSHTQWGEMTKNDTGLDSTEPVKEKLKPKNLHTNTPHILN